MEKTECEYINECYKFYYRKREQNCKDNFEQCFLREAFEKYYKSRREIQINKDIILKN